MAIVYTYVSGSGFSRVFRGGWSHEVQFLKLDFFVEICIHRHYGLSISAHPRSRLALGLDWGEKTHERRRGVQRKVFHLLSLVERTNRASLLPIHGRTRGILRRGLYVLWAGSPR